MTTATAKHFIDKIIDEDLSTKKHQSIITRFPPEPNGFLHIGHAKSICLNFGVANQYQGTCHLRFDDTNPVKEEQLYIEAIKKDVAWLGFDWQQHLYHSSDYFEQLYGFAVELIEKGLAYVDDLSAEQMRDYRGTLTEPGKNSPSRERDSNESLDLFKRMRAGEFAEGRYTLRAKIDMAAANINLRDPILYRILNASHPRTGDAWCIYPMYDFAHALSDALELITHSLCTLEFQDHRPLYEWFLEHVSVPSTPRQIEFSRLNINYTITSKRKLKSLVDGGHVSGWDDPRMPTISGMRRRGFTSDAIRNFCAEIGISRQDSVIDIGLLESAVRDDLNTRAPRRMAVLRPIKVVITNMDQDFSQSLLMANHPQDEAQGKREVILTRELYIEQDDFMLDPPSKYFRLKPGGRVRLRNAYVIQCDEVIKDAAGQVIELHCSYDPDTFGGQKPADGKKIKGIIHWVSAQHSLPATVHCYDRLFNVENPAALDDYTQALNPHSFECLTEARIEPDLANFTAEMPVQFTRLGYFVVDAKDHSADKPVFNQIVALRDTWQKP